MKRDPPAPLRAPVAAPEVRPLWPAPACAGTRGAAGPQPPRAAPPVARHSRWRGGTRIRSAAARSGPDKGAGAAHALLLIADGASCTHARSPLGLMSDLPEGPCPSVRAEPVEAKALPVPALRQAQGERGGWPALRRAQGERGLSETGLLSGMGQTTMKMPLRLASAAPQAALCRAAGGLIALFLIASSACCISARGPFGIKP